MLLWRLPATKLQRLLLHLPLRVLLPHLKFNLSSIFCKALNSLMLLGRYKYADWLGIWLCC